MTGTRPAAALTLSAVVLAAPPALADDPGDPFDKGSWVASVYGGYSGEFTADREEAYAWATFGVGYYLADNFALNGELSVYRWDQEPGDDPVAGGFNLVPRWHFLRDDAWAAHLEAVFGVSLADDDVPEAGSDPFNFVLGLGVGGTWRVADGVMLLAGVRYTHVSNAGLGDTNPGYDGIGGYLGLMFPF